MSTATAANKNQHISRQGSNYYIENSANSEVTPQLPAGTYVVRFNPMAGGFFFAKTDDMKLPSKIYGNELKSRTARIIHTYNSRTSNTAVLATGEKGSGKTLLAKSVAAAMISNGKPVIYIDKSFEDFAGFNQFIGKLNTPAMILIDEFEKLFDQDDQKHLLSLLDGTSTSKHLYFFTTNDEAIDSHMINRPGRIYYLFRYDSLPIESVAEYVKEHLQHKKYHEELVGVCQMFTSLNFDIVQAIVEEVNRYGERPRDAVKHLNASPAAEAVSTYKVGLSWNDRMIDIQYPFVGDSPIIDNDDVYINFNGSTQAEKLNTLFGQHKDRSSKNTFMDNHIRVDARDFSHFEGASHVYKKTLKVAGKQHTFSIILTPSKMKKHRFAF